MTLAECGLPAVMCTYICLRAVTPCGSYLSFVVLLFLPPLAFLFASSNISFQLGIKTVCLRAKPRSNAVKDGIFLDFFFNVVIFFCGLRVLTSIALMGFSTFVFILFQL